jgi:tetratricopeptide (TPR) repeat protein
MTHAIENEHTPSGIDRRGFLWRAGLTAGVCTMLPLLGAPRGAIASAEAPSAIDPDDLFKSGQFAEAEQGYAQLLHDDPSNEHAAAQLGYIALLSNHFHRAEYYLRKALRLASGDIPSKARLADCFIRQDLFVRAVPLLPDAQAKQLAAIKGRPYQIRGASATRVPFLDVDPLPHIEASVSGGAAGTFVLDTGEESLMLSSDAAKKAGLRAISSSTARLAGQDVTVYRGVASSLRLGEIEVRNIPVNWADGPLPALPNGGPPDGVVGTKIFYHFLTTMDYKGGALLLRQKTPANQRRLQAEAARAAIRPQPLWLAGDHLPCTLGKLNDYGPRIASMDTGTVGAGLVTSVANAERADITIDWDHPGHVNGDTLVYPIIADRMSIGDAVGRHVLGSAGPTPWEAMTQFDTIGNFTHEFFKPFAVTFDFAGMNLFLG